MSNNVCVLLGIRSTIRLSTLTNPPNIKPSIPLVLTSDEEDTAEAFHQDESPESSPVYDRAGLEAIALAATPDFQTLGENAKIHLDKEFPSADGNAANTDLTPFYPELENMSNSGKPKLLEDVLGIFTTQICDPESGLWIDGPELDIQRTAMKVDKVRMPSFEARGWQISWI